jgi:AcrR family transcriptional regulator
MSQPIASRPRHHANLREALVEVGLAILAEGLPLSLRQVAARAGVSHAAPAHHFSGLAGLQAAIAARAFDLFTASMEARRNAASPDPEERLIAICQGYADFAQSHARLFGLMFSSHDIDRCDTGLIEASGRAYAMLKDGCAPFAADGVTARRLEVTIWSLIHGYSALGFAAAKQPSPIRPLPDLASVLRPLIASFRRNPPHGLAGRTDFLLAPPPPSD